jgi:hypothetical protein
LKRNACFGDEPAAWAIEATQKSFARKVTPSSARTEQAS